MPTLKISDDLLLSWGVRTSGNLIASLTQEEDEILLDVDELVELFKLIPEILKLTPKHLERGEHE